MAMLLLKSQHFARLRHACPGFRAWGPGDHTCRQGAGKIDRSAGGSSRALCSEGALRLEERTPGFHELPSCLVAQVIGAKSPGVTRCFLSVQSIRTYQNPIKSISAS